jgi:hypothetical protein
MLSYRPQKHRAKGTHTHPKRLFNFPAKKHGLHNKQIVDIQQQSSSSPKNKKKTTTKSSSLYIPQYNPQITHRTKFFTNFPKFPPLKH